MRRRTIHSAFAVIALTCAAVAGYQAVRLQQASRVNASIAGATPMNGDSSIPEAQFAHALALSRAGEPEAALKAYKALVQGNRPDLRVAALFNLGNLHMREAEKNLAQDPTQSLPLIELAKQSYRDVLRSQPSDWDARYNLERALQLAPEVEDEPVNDDNQEAPEEHVSSTLRGAKMDLP
jgi:mxaK protein